MGKYDIQVSGNAPAEYPTQLFFGLLWNTTVEAIELPQKYPFENEWGEPVSNQAMERTDYEMPYKLDMVWLSIAEEKFYSIEIDLPVYAFEQIWQTSKANFTHIVVGMAPGGRVALWFYGIGRQEWLGWLKGKEINVDMSDFNPYNPSLTLHEFCSSIEKDRPYLTIGDPLYIEEGIKSYNDYMRQYVYRYLPILEKYDEHDGEYCWMKYNPEEQQPSCILVEDALNDGSFDKLNDGRLLSYHEGSAPNKLKINIQKGKMTWTMNIWFDKNKISGLFNKFYGAHRDTKVDFIIRIDAENKKYELALYRYGLKEPMIIKDDVYQLIAFKNKFEDYRSDNYDQPNGAWIW